MKKQKKEKTKTQWVDMDPEQTLAIIKVPNGGKSSNEKPDHYTMGGSALDGGESITATSALTTANSCSLTLQQPIPIQNMLLFFSLGSACLPSHAQFNFNAAIPQLLKC